MATEQKGESEIQTNDGNEDYFKALDDYFQLKEDYETAYKEKVQKIGRGIESKSKKMKKIRDLKSKRLCISCGNLGGTQFEIGTASDGTKEYTAFCLASIRGNGEDCGLDIRLKKGTVIQASLKENEVLKNIEQIKQNIISGKLSLLFNLETEDIALKEFDDLKFDLEKASDRLKMIEDKFTSNNTIQILKEKTGEPEIINKKQFIKIKRKKLNEFIYKFKETSKLADNETSNVKKKGFWGDAFMALYKDIEPLQNEIRNLLYQESFIETNDDRKEKTKFDPIIYYTMNREVSINNDEIIGDDYSIKSNEK